MGRKIFADISKQALIHNFNRVKQIAPKSKVLAMIKANAYGHGIISVAKTLNQADAFGVANIEEALLLRQSGIAQPIVLMEGFFKSTELQWIVAYDFIPVIHQFEQVKALAQQDNKKNISVWIKVNTGMNRLGFQPADLRRVYEQLSNMPHITIIGFMTHFAKADLTDDPATQQQAEAFFSLTESLPGEKCLANSAAILAWAASHCDWVRPGLMLYGASPFSDKTSADLDLKPVMQLETEVIAIQSVPKGQCVGYGGQWQAKTDCTRVAVISIGYGDGYPWHAKSGTPVLVNQTLTQLVGRVSMDMIVADVSQVPNVQVGDPVQLWGPQLPIETVAKGASTIPYELFCRLTDRVSMRVVD